MFSYNKLKDFFPFFCLFLQGFVSTTFTLIILYYDIKFNKKCSRIPSTFLYRRVGSSLQECSDHLNMTLVGGSVQGCGSSLSPGIHIRPVPHQQLQ